MGPGRRWVVLAAVTLAQAAVSCAQVGLLTIGPTLSTTFGLTAAQSGLVGSAVTAGMVPALVPWGAVADRYGVRSTLLTGLPLTSIALAASGTARTGVQLAAGLAMAGAFGASTVTGTSRAVFDWFGPGELALALGIRQSAIPLGGTMAALLLPFTSRTVGLGAVTAALSLTVALSAAGVAVALTVVDHPPVGPPEAAR